MDDWITWLIVLLGVPMVIAIAREIVKKTKPEWDDRIVDLLESAWGIFKPAVQKKANDALAKKDETEKPKT